MSTDTQFIPPQLVSIPILLELNDSISLEDFTKNFSELWFQSTHPFDGPISREMFTFNFTIQQELPVLNINSVSLKYDSSTYEKSMNLANTLGSLLLDIYPKLPNETIDSWFVSVTTEPFPDIEAGTIVFHRKTSISTIQFILYNLHFDLNTASPKILLPQQSNGDYSNAIISNIINTSDNQTPAEIKYFFRIMGTLAWALPHPWGAAAAGVVSVLEMLLPEQNGDAQIIVQAIKEIENYAKQQKIADEISKMNQFNEWIKNTLETIVSADKEKIDLKARLEGSDAQEGWIHILGRLISPDGGLYSAIFNIERFLDDEDDDAFNVYVLSISMFLLAKKILLQFQALLASKYDDPSLDIESFNKYNDAWRLEFVSFRNNINGFNDGSLNSDGFRKKILNVIVRKISNRLKLVSPTTRHSFRVSHCIRYDCTYADHYGWTWTDSHESNLTDPEKNFVEDDVDQTCCSKTVKSYFPKVENQRVQYLAALENNMNVRYEQFRAAEAALGSTIDSWSAHLPPIIVDEMVVIDIKNWNNTPAPNDINWKSENHVSYAVQFKNSKGPSKIGKFTESVQIIENFSPRLINIPQDPMGVTEKVIIYRKIADSSSIELSVRAIAIIESGSKSFVDNIQNH